MLSATDNEAELHMVADLDALRGELAALAVDDELLDAIVDGARAHSAPVAALPRQETVRHVPALLSSALAAFAGNRGLSRAELAAAARLGEDRAEQGVPLAALLDGFQAGRAEAIKVAMTRTRAAGVPAEVLLDALVELDGLISELEHQLTHAHHATELERARTAREQRAWLLRRLLLARGEATDEPLAQPLRAAGLDPAGMLFCLVSAEHEPRAAHRLEARLAGAARGIYGLLGGYLVGVSARVPDCAEATLLVTGPAVPVTELPESYRMCCAARDAGLRDGATGRLALTELAVDAALDTLPGLGRTLAGQRLAALTPADAFHRELAATALAHLDHGGRLEAAAHALHVHPNTVKYRLRRLRELTGFGADADPPGGAVRAAVHWWWALRTWQRSASG